jgi:hypothetical protein
MSGQTLFSVFRYSPLPEKAKSPFTRRTERERWKAEKESVKDYEAISSCSNLLADVPKSGAHL